MITNIEAITALKPNRLESKAQATDSAARAIIEADAAKRDAKTLRLRAARLKAEADNPEVPKLPKVKPTRARKR